MVAADSSSANPLAHQKIGDRFGHRHLAQELATELTGKSQWALASQIFGAQPNGYQNVFAGAFGHQTHLFALLEQLIDSIFAGSYVSSMHLVVYLRHCSRRGGLAGRFMPFIYIKLELKAAIF